MSRPDRPEEHPGATVGGAVNGDASPTAAPGALPPPEVLRDAQRAAVDLLVFAPIGFVKRARSLLPDLIREGRSTAASARMIGKFVTPIARQQGTKLVKAKVAELSRSASAVRSSSTPPVAERTDERPGDASNPKSKVARKRPPRRGESSPKGSSVRHEPFSGYDHLGSAAVVARLGELSKAERAAVRAYETSNRKRRTVLGRLDQLDSSR